MVHMGSPPKPDGAGRPVGTTRAEVLTALSLAIDLGLGQPMEHMLRSAVIASRLARHLGLDEEQRKTAYFATLVMWIGCHADSHEYAAWFGDDIRVRSEAYELDWSGLPYARFLLSNVGRGRPLPRRAQVLASLLVDAKGNLSRLILSHCTSAGLLAERVGLGSEVRDVLAFTFERWDGGGLPVGARGVGIPVEMRVAQLADVAEVHLREYGVDGALAMVRSRSGRQFDPEIVATFESCVDDLVGDLSDGNARNLALEEAGDRDRVLSRDELDDFLVAMGDFVDLKCPFTLGHSRAVAASVASAGDCLGLPEAEVQLVRRAGHLHDIGRIGVSNQIWEKAGPLSSNEWERVRLHPYFSRRIVSQIPGLEAEAALVEMHHERQDGSGYPHGLQGAGSTSSRVCWPRRRATSRQESQGPIEMRWTRALRAIGCWAKPDPVGSTLEQWMRCSRQPAFPPRNDKGGPRGSPPARSRCCDWSPTPGRIARLPTS